jgi:hypothetical protein
MIIHMIQMHDIGAFFFFLVLVPVLAPAVSTCTSHSISVSPNVNLSRCCIVSELESFMERLSFLPVWRLIKWRMVTFLELSSRWLLLLVVS